MDQPAFLTIAEFAAEIRVSEDTVWRMIAAGRVDAVRVSERLTRIPRSELERLATPLELGEPEEQAS